MSVYNIKDNGDDDDDDDDDDDYEEHSACYPPGREKPFSCAGVDSVGWPNGTTVEVWRYQYDDDGKWPRADRGRVAEAGRSCRMEGEGYFPYEEFMGASHRTHSIDDGSRDQKIKSRISKGTRVISPRRAFSTNDHS